VLFRYPLDNAQRASWPGQLWRVPRTRQPRKGETRIDVSPPRAVPVWL